MQKWASSTACKEQGEKHWRETLTESRPWEERVQPSRGPGPGGGLSREDAMRPRLSPSRAQPQSPQQGSSWGARRFRATRSRQRGHGCSANDPGCWEEPRPPCTKTLATGKPACIVPAAPSAARPCQSHGTVAPSPRTTRRESRRSSKEHRLMRRRKEGGMLGS